MYGDVIMRREGEYMVIKWENGDRYTIHRLDVPAGAPNEFAKVVRADGTDGWKLLHGPELGEVTAGTWYEVGGLYRDWYAAVDRGLSELRWSQSDPTSTTRTSKWKRVLFMLRGQWS